LTDAARNSWGFSLFCDDIRAEVGGKMSIMGVYQADMIFPTNQNFPLTVPKFCILIKYYEILNFFTDEIAISIFLPGDAKDAPTIVLPIPRANLAGPTFPYPLEDDQERVFNITFPVALSPFTINQEGFLKVRAKCGSTTTNLGSLMIRKARADEIIEGLSPPTQAPPISPPIDSALIVGPPFLCRLPRNLRPFLCVKLSARAFPPFLPNATSPDRPSLSRRAKETGPSRGKLRL
jgi:hypothetical protein